MNDPLTWVENIAKRFKVAPIEGALRFAGGLAGYFGYDTVRHIEPKLAEHQQSPIPSAHRTSC